MSSSIAVSMAIYAALFFGAGWGWGQWWAERRARRDKAAMEKGRLNVSMPVHADKASEVLRVLSVLMKEVDDRPCGAICAGKVRDGVECKPGACAVRNPPNGPS